MVRQGIEPDEEAILMMTVCDKMKVAHRLIFHSEIKPTIVPKEATFYALSFQVADACDRSGWITIPHTSALVKWIASKGL